MSLIIALASMRASMHVFRLLVNRGLISPKDVDDSSIAVIADLKQLPEEMHGAIQDYVETTFIELREAAAATWRGDD